MEMNNQSAYDLWSENYDAVVNPTRDIEAKALRESINGGEIGRILEIGCGTGKNTEYLVTLSREVVGADFSEEMLGRAKVKLANKNVQFHQIDLRENWKFEESGFDLVTCSLALEHIENLNFVFSEARRVLRVGGRFYFGELHPFKQYQGSKARFETNGKVFELECFIHNLSDYFSAAIGNRFECSEVKEWFDGEDQTEIPRLLSMILVATR